MGAPVITEDRVGRDSPTQASPLVKPGATQLGVTCPVLSTIPCGQELALLHK